jgi:hypothetical protein
MTPIYYEIHLTIRPEEREAAKELANQYHFDLDLRGFFTKKSKDLHQLIYEGEFLAADLKQIKLHPLRIKIEQIIQDIYFGDSDD